MKFLALAALLMSTSSMAFTVNEGLYISEQGCKVEVFKSLDGEMVFDYESSPDNEIYSYGNTVFTPSFSSVLNGPGLCGDEIGLPEAEVSKTSNSLNVDCGGKLSVIDIEMNITTKDNGDLESFSFVSKIARISTLGGWGLPQPKKTKDNMDCTDFIKQ